MARFMSLLGILCLLLSALTAFLFWDRYWRWRHCFNESDRCFDPVANEVHLAQSGVAWGAIFVLSLILAVGLLAFAGRRR